MIFQKVFHFIKHHVLEVRMRFMLHHKSIECRQISIGSRVVIHVFQRFFNGEMVGSRKRMMQIFRQFFHKVSAQQMFSDGTSAAFITNQKSQRRKFFSDGMSVEIARVGPSSQYADDGWFAVVSSIGSSGKVFFYSYLCVGKKML